MFCTNCGQRVGEKDIFCANCGTRIAESVPAPSAASTPAPPAPEPATRPAPAAASVVPVSVQKKPPVKQNVNVVTIEPKPVEVHTAKPAVPLDDGTVYAAETFADDSRAKVTLDKISLIKGNSLSGSSSSSQQGESRLTLEKSPFVNASEPDNTRSKQVPVASGTVVNVQQVPVVSGTVVNAQPAQNGDRAAGELPSSGEVNAYPVQSVQYTQPQKNTAAVAGAIAGVSVFLVVACILLFVKPGFLKKTDADDSDSDSENTSSVVSSHSSSQMTESTAESAADSSKQSSLSASSAVSSDTSSSSSSKTVSTWTVYLPKEAPAKSASSAASSKAASSKAASSTAPSSAPAVQSKPAAVSQYVPEPQPEPQPDPQPQPTPQPEYSENDAAYAEAMAYSTNARPTFSEFDWCYGQFGLVYEPPGNADRITNSLGFSGGWKCMIIYNPTNNAGTFIRELDNVSIGVNGGAVDLTVDWYLMSNDAQAGLENEEDMADTLFLGSASNGGVSVSNAERNTSMNINYFWKDDGKEYALGTMRLSDGLEAYVALTR